MSINTKTGVNNFFLGAILVVLFGLFLGYTYIYLPITDYEYESLVILGSYFVVAFLYLFTIIIERDLDLFHPIHLVTFLYLCIFIFTPLMLIAIGRPNSWGVDIMGGSIKATIIFTLSYLFYVLGYLNVKLKNMNFLTYPKPSETLKKSILKVSYIVWFIAFLLSLYYLFITGRSITYILSLGNSGQTYSQDTNMLFLSNFTLCMIVPLLYIFRFSKSKYIFFIFAFLTFSTMYIRGFRIFILIMLIGLFIVYFKGKAKKPPIRIILLSLFFLIFFFTLLGSLRGGLRNGNTEESNFQFNVESVTYMFESNFEIYKPFYGVVLQYPENYEHTLGKSMFWDSIINWIPRSVWSAKPLAVDQTMPIGLMNSVNKEAITNGAMAWPNIGEIYMEFGILGCFIIFYAFGILSKKTLRLYYSPNINNLIAYSVLIPLIFQYVIRGAFSQFIPFLLFTLLPYIIINKVQKVKIN